MSRSSHRPPRGRNLVERVMKAGREAGTGAILFQQAVGHVLGLNSSDMKCLDVISTNSVSSPKELADLTGLTTGAVTVLIDRLEKAHLIEREADPDDRRKKRLVPTKEAKKRVGPLYQPMARGMHQLMSEYSDKELALLERFFTESIVFWKREIERLLEKTETSK